MQGPVRVSVPATSANLGPGFDTLGLALDLRDELEAQVLTGGLVVEVSGEGAEGVPRDESHLVVRSIRVGLEELGASVPGLRLSCRNVIPHARGLGSSSAAIVGGLALARALVVDGTARLDDARLLDLAARIEGHPDNVAPAVLGGFVVAGQDADGTAWAVPAPVSAAVSTVVLVPPDPVSTELARGLLPASVPHGDAAANAGRAALLVAALATAPEQLLRATEDRLHQHYRRPAMPASLDLVDTLRAAGIAAIISGAGPTVLALVTSGAGLVEQHCPPGWTVHRLPVSALGVRQESAAPR